MLDGIFKKQSNIRIIVSITSSISMIIDNIFISRFIGMDGVAAAGLITPVLMIILAFSGVLSSGGQLIVGPKMGAGEKDKAIGSVSLCFMLVFISSVIVISGAFLFTDGICAFLGAEPGSELMSMAGEYLKGYMIGTPGIIGMLAIVPLLNIDGDKKRSYVSAWAVTISDIVLDIVAVIVFPGSIGAIALATAISYLLGLIIISGHFIKKDNRYGLRIRFNNIPWGETRDVFSLGFPAALQKVLRTMLTFTINQILLFVGGSIALAGFSIVSNIGNLMNSVGQGLSAATLTISGVLHGERIKKSLKDLYRAFIKYSVLWNLVMVIITILGAEVLVGIYLSAKKVDVTAVIMGVRLFSFDYIFYSLCLCAKNYYLGIKQMKVNYIITIVEGYICIAFFTFLLGKLFGFYGVCIGYGIGDMVSVLSIVAGVWITNKRFPKKFDDFLLADDAVPEEKTFYAGVSRAGDIERISREAGEFVRRQLGTETAQEVAENINNVVENTNNVVENTNNVAENINNVAENTNNVVVNTASVIKAYSAAIIEKGFPNKKKPAMELNLLCEDEGITLLINDNCKGFLVTEHVDSAAMPVKSAEQYQVLGLNKTKVIIE